MNDKYTITYGATKGSKQLTFHFVSKMSVAELLTAIGEHFPGVHSSELNLLPGIASCVVTTGKDFEVKAM